jgi:thymidylate kinase
MLVAIEGADGCGKDTVANLLAARLGAGRLNFPNNAGVTGPLIRAYLAREWFVECTLYGCRVDLKEAAAMAFQALQLVNRMEVITQLEEATRTDHHLILARYWQSGWVYGQFDGLDPAFLRNIHSSLVKPQFNILLDVDPQTAIQRRDARDGTTPPERYEGKHEWLSKVINLYRTLWKQEKAEGKPGWLVVDANQPVDAVVDIIHTAIQTARD